MTIGSATARPGNTRAVPLHCKLDNPTSGVELAVLIAADEKLLQE